MDCKRCDKLLTENNCYRSDFIKKCRICKDCRKKSYKINITKEKEFVYSKIRDLNLKKEIFNIYGTSCECCNENIWQFLTIDHINNSGADHRREISGKNGSCGQNFYQWLKNNKFPKNGYRTLCMNCNTSYGFHGFCKHNSLLSNKCDNCNVDLNDLNTFSFYNKCNINLCKICVLNKSIKRRAVIVDKNLPQRRLYNKSKTLQKREILLSGYGNKCDCCDEKNLMCLTIDHINNDGAAQRKLFSNVNQEYAQLIKQDFPKDNYQLLCANCNMCKQSYGECYHKLQQKLKLETISIEYYKDYVRKIYELR